MGSILGKPMEETLRKNQEFLLEMQKMQLERQIQMHNQMRERHLAMQIARARELFFWFGSFHLMTSLILLKKYRKTKNSTLLLPLLPLTFILAYQGDLAYGSKLNRIKGEAENIMEFETQLLHMPCGVPSASSIDQARRRQIDEQRIRKVHELYI